MPSGGPFLDVELLFNLAGAVFAIAGMFAFGALSLALML
jgi:hypothetical protein